MKIADMYIFLKLIWLVPVLFIFFMWAAKKERKIIGRFAEKDMLKTIAPFYGRDYRLLRRALTLFAMFFLVLAFSRPQWGFFWKDEKRMGLDILIAVDTSNSMLAVDVRPDRLRFAKNELNDFIKTLRYDRVGLIAFEGEAFLQCPLTFAYSGFKLALNDLDVDTIPKGGTSIESAIDEAIRSYKGALTDNKVLIIITDGENTDGDLEGALSRAKQEGMMICTIGIGTKDGAYLKIPDSRGKLEFVKDNYGNKIKSKLMENTLKKIAGYTGGIYVQAKQSGLGLNRIYTERLSEFEKERFEDKKVRVFKERFQYPVAAAFVLLFLELLLRGRFRKK